MKKILVITLMFIGFGCSHQPSEMDIRSTITGVWSTKYNPRMEINLVCDTPYVKTNFGEGKLDILSIDRENLSVRFKERNKLGKKGIIKLEEISKGKYILIWNYDGGTVMQCSYISKIYN
jgi:hypothetical protein